MPSPLAEILGQLGAAFARAGVRWYVFGAQAAIPHGAARLSADVDVTVELAGSSLPDLLSQALDRRDLLPVLEELLAGGRL